MKETELTKDQIIERGEQIYYSTIRSAVETGNDGKFLVINVATGEYEMDRDDLTVSKRARARFPDAPLYTKRIGHDAAYRLGCHLGSGSS